MTYLRHSLKNCTAVVMGRKWYTIFGIPKITKVSWQKQRINIIGHELADNGGRAGIRLLGSRVRVQLVAQMFVSCVCSCCVGKSHCEGPITRPGESSRVCVSHFAW
jgi:hypothetical protein